MLNYIIQKTQFFFKYLTNTQEISTWTTSWTPSSKFQATFWSTSPEGSDGGPPSASSSWPPEPSVSPPCCPLSWRGTETRFPPPRPRPARFWRSRESCLRPRFSRSYTRWPRNASPQAPGMLACSYYRRFNLVVRLFKAKYILCSSITRLEIDYTLFN